MFGISFEHLLIVGVILLIVGPKRLPELGNTMGKAIKNFKDSFSGIEEASFKRIAETQKEEQKTKSPDQVAPDASTLSQKVAESTLTPSAFDTPSEDRNHGTPTPPPV